jgi:hypothetical protein
MMWQSARHAPRIANAHPALLLLRPLDASEFPKRYPERRGALLQRQLFHAHRLPEVVSSERHLCDEVCGDILEFGAVTFGKPELKEAVATEIVRRRAEVDATGESAWCSYQRSSMIADGLRDLFR